MFFKKSRIKKYLENGDSYYQRKNYNQAIEEFTKAIKLNSRLSIAYKNRGLAYTDRGYDYSIAGDYDRAIADYNQAVRLNPNDADAF